MGRQLRPDAVGVVVEIGAGSTGGAPRPVARGALHVVTDVDGAVLGGGAARPAIVADGAWLPLRAGSVDHVIARNVFGDVGLGHSFEQVTGFDPPAYAAHVRALVARGATDELQALRGRVQAMADAVSALRSSLLVEAARVLRPGGALVIVETLTPGFAEAWLHERCGGRVKDHGRLLAGGAAFACRAVRTHAKRQRYCSADELLHPDLRVWVLLPRSDRPLTGPAQD